MKYYSLFFEARGIQSYIFDSGKMKEMVGASELVKSLCGNNLDQVIDYLKLERIIPSCKADSIKLNNMNENQVFFSRRSGGVFTALFASKDIRDKFLEIWSLLVLAKVPGLEFVNAVSEGENIVELIKESYGKLAQNRNNPMVMVPEATAMHILAPRTGKPAVINNPSPDGKKVWMDEASDIKSKVKSSILSDSFLGDDYKNKYKFPSNLEYDENGKTEFPFLSGSRYLGLVHADGNGLGQTLIDIRKKFTDGAEYAILLRLFSDALEEATKTAAQEATAKLINELNPNDIRNEKLPMRPLVLGGDDLTVLVRADLAMKFTKDYCIAFEECTKEYFAKLHEESNGAIPEKLTACAGLAYVKNNQPFMDAFELVESLCSASKKVSKEKDKNPVPASVTYTVVSNSFIESYEDFRKKELTIKKGDKTFIATMGTYALRDDETRIPTLASLNNLCDALSANGVTSANVRQYATMIFGDPNISREKWRRWIQLLNEAKKGKDLFDKLNDLKVNKPEESPWTDDNQTPVFDAIQLMEMEGR